MRGGDAVVAGLRDEGIDTVFGIPASHVVEVYDALARDTHVKTFIARNEQSATYMADGYARRSLSPGVVVVTGGPGLGNAITGLQTAYADSSPVVVIASDLDEPDRARVPLGIPHEAFRQADLARSTGAHVVRADSSANVRSAVRKAVALARQGRHRPAVCIISRGALEGSAHDVDSVEAEYVVSMPHPKASDAEQVARLLCDADRPIVLAGAGIVWSGAENRLSEFLATTGVPCLTTIPGRGSVSNASGHWAGLAADTDNLEKLGAADLVLALGTSFGSATTDSWRLHLSGKLVHVDIDPDEIGKHYPADMAIVADVGEFLDLLTAALSKRAFHDAEHDISAPRTRQPWFDAIDDVLPGDQVTVVGDVTTALRWLPRSLKLGGGRRFILPWNFMTMGWALGAALGVKAAAPGERVLAVMGDGGALFCLGELATAVENHLPICLLVFNNHSYGTIAELQDDFCEGRRFGVDLATPDFVGVAKAFGLQAHRTLQPSDLGKALASAFDSDEPSLIEAIVHLEEFRIPLTPRAQTATDSSWPKEEK